MFFITLLWLFLMVHSLMQRSVNCYQDQICNLNKVLLSLARYWRRTLGLKVFYADCGGYRFCYSSRGRPSLRPSILMLHNFSAHKDTWLSLIKVCNPHFFTENQVPRWYDFVPYYMYAVPSQTSAHSVCGHAGTWGDNTYQCRRLLYPGTG